MGFGGYDTFKIEKKYNLCGEDLFSLTNLYLPIVGVDGFSLYLLLCELKDSEEYLVTKLLDSLSFPTINFLEQSLSKIEAIGLVKTFQKKEEYIFVLDTPLSVDSFLNNHILFDFLKSKIGETEINKIISSPQKKSSYKEITKSFDEVYEKTTESIKNVLPSIFKRLISDSIYIKNEKFDYIYFKLSFDESILSQDILNDKYFKEEILKISYHYNLNEEEMHQAVIDTLYQTKDISLKDISKNAIKIYQMKTVEPIKFVTKEADPFMYEKLDDNTLRFLDIVENMSCENLLKSLSKIKASTSELKMLDDLIRNTNFSQGIINIMVLYVLEINKGVLPGYNYFEKIANTWKRAKVSTAKDALDLINKEKEPEEKKKVYKGKVKETPDWYDEYENKLKESSKTNETIEDKEKDLEAVLASGLFKSKEE